MNRKTFDLQTKIGLVYLIVNGASEIMVDTKKREDYKDVVSSVTIRGKQYKGNVRFKWDGTQWDGRCYASDGNTLIFVGTDSEWNKARATFLMESGDWKDASHAARLKFYDEIKSAVNEFYRLRQADINYERSLRAAEFKAGEIESLENQIKETEKTLVDLNEKLRLARLS
jgi:hypothetical protein